MIDEEKQYEKRYNYLKEKYGVIKWKQKRYYKFLQT
jgi:hypothetical protein